VDVEAGRIAPLWHELMEVSPTLALTNSGLLSLGLGPAGGPFQWVGFVEPLQPVPFPLPASLGYPLTP